jgi:putative MATE family efflux protein
MMISALYNAADTFFVGSLGTSATAGVGVAFPLMAIIQAVGFFFGHGSGNYVSRRLGAQKFDDASRMAATGFVSALVCGASISALGLAFIGELAVFLGATPTILPHSRDYLFYILLGAPWMTGSLMLNNLLRFQGSAFYGMIGMTSGAILNVVLDPIFIYLLNMGAGGAALATMISQFVGFCLLLVGCSRRGNIHILLRDFSPHLALYREIFRGGVPSLFRQSFASIATICVNRMAGGYGDAAIAAMSIVTRVTMLANSAVIGLGQGFQPVCGFNYGARLYGRVKRAFWFCVKAATVVLTLTAIVCWIFAPEIIAIFRRDDADVIRIGAFALRLQFTAVPMMGWVNLSNMMLQTMGKSMSASALALARQGLFLLPLLYILTHFLGLLGIQTSQPIADAVTFVFSIPLYIAVSRGLKEG